MSNRRHVSLAGAAVALAALATLAPSVHAQDPDPAACAQLKSVLEKRFVASKAGTVVLGALRAANDSVKVPHWYLVSALQAIVSHFRAERIRYDPIADISVAMTVSTRGVRVSPQPFGRRVVIITGVRVITSAIQVERGPIVDTAGDYRHGIEAAVAQVRDTTRFPVDTASALGRLSAAIAAAGADSSLAPPPVDVGDSVTLLLTLRPSLDSVLVPLDGREVYAPLFRVSGLHDGAASTAFYDGETLVRAISHPPEPMPPWPPAHRDIKGVVIARLMVNEQGRVDPAASIVQYATPGFGESTLETLRGWHFAPARLDGRPVRAEVGVGVVFRR